MEEIAKSFVDPQYIKMEIYKKEMREMQREINYLRKRVTQLNDELEAHRDHTKKSIQYIESSVDDLQYEFELKDI
jgi:predicted RNase H-like nuclease (RuvC/YqgF family)